jgi:hypothetical protein
MVLVVIPIQQALGASENDSKAAKSHCLTFSKNQSVNRVLQFKKIYHIDAQSIIYSSSFDLNNDGVPEYLYFLNEPGAVHCGTMSLQLGCPLEILQYTPKNRFVYLDNGTEFPGLDFKPDKHFAGYLCVKPNEESGGYDLFANSWWRKDHQKRTLQLSWPQS